MTDQLDMLFDAIAEDNPCPFVPGKSCYSPMYQGFCPQCKCYPADKLIKMSPMDIWEYLEPLAMPVGESRVIREEGGQANVSPLTETGDTFWRFVVWHEPWPHNDEHIAKARAFFAQKGIRGEELQTMLSHLLNGMKNADLPALWWKGRQCFWHREQIKFMDTCLELLNARVAINSCEYLLRELEVKP